ncbi:hypothetical protein B0H16DRAFT_1478875 [Mycena metata]|uniref:BHLH domain-containing protein n=1 Tax=Mycena metata TaxID=1033252 RepID=A0AAD7H6J0_9AGAR|nr:hypothetical protein B0H16DRAFT_1478875 [Mycena metata]
MHGSLPDFSHSPLCLFSPRLPLLVNRGITVTPDRGKQLCPGGEGGIIEIVEMTRSYPTSVAFTSDRQILVGRGQPFGGASRGLPLPSSRVRERWQHQLLLPPLSMRAASVDTGYSPSTDDPTAKLATRVRKNAGVVLAVQIGSEPNTSRTSPRRLLPRLPSYPTPNIAASAFATAPVAPSAPPMPATPVQSATHSRPKTSHTTIERRYHTNVNARIQSLRQAVPALRVVDRAAAIKAGDASDPEDHIDARGFVDGVNIARKCSKANVLGKAVEYIRVLKNREKRLTRELEGLKILLRGLVGGTELLGEWEREGGESDDEGGGRGRKRKKAKVAVEPAPKVQVERKPAAPVQEGEKKRGRPRKIVPLLASDCVHKSTVRVILSLRNVYVVSVGQHGIGGKGKEASSPSLSFPAVVPHVVVPFGSPAIASPLRTRAVESSTPQGMHIPYACPACCARPHPPRVRLRPYPPSPMPSPPFPALMHNATLPSRVQLALGSDATHAHTHVVCVRVESPRSSPGPSQFSPPFPPFPAAPAHAVELSADCTELDLAVVQLRMHMPCVLLARGDARAEFARTHCADVRPLCCIPAPPLSSLPSPSLPFPSLYLPHVRYLVKSARLE